MENLSGYTPTELLVMINKIKIEHDAIKQEIINDTYSIEELEKLINNKINKLTDIEKNYIALIEELNNRK
jgi:hypothetical protein